jgi:Fe2+-dicitrate sensor, membrane component
MTNTDIEEALLIAGEVVRYSEVIESLDIVRAEDIRRKLAWQHGALIFKGESLDQAVAEISRYTDKHIIITDPFLAKLRVGGHYKTDDIEALFASLGQGLQIRVDHQGDRILLSAMN